MVKFFKSLQTQLTLGFLILIVLVAGLTFYFVVDEAKQALTAQMREELELSADIMGRQINGDLLNQIHSAEDTENEAFMALVDQMWELRGDNNGDLIIYAYIFQIYEDDTLVFAVDSDYMSDDGEIDVYAHDVYEDADLDLVKEGLKGPVSTAEPYTDEWGTFMTGYAPIYDSDGNAIAILGVDMDIATVKDKQDFLSSLVYYVMGGAILLSVLAIFYFSTTVIKDLNALTKAANKISQGNVNVKIPEIKAENEVREMGESLKAVLAAVDFLREQLGMNKKPKKGGRK